MVETNNEESTVHDWESIMKSDEEFCQKIMSSDEDPIQKMKMLICNPNSSEDIVSELLRLGPYLENYLEGSEEFGAGEDLSNFISTNIHRFDALECLMNDVKQNQYRTLYEQNRRFVLDVGTAVAMRNLYWNLDLLYQPTDSQDEKAVREYYAEAMSLVEICAVYFQETKQKTESDITYYRFGQSVYFKKSFDILRADLPLANEKAKEPDNKKTKASIAGVDEALAKKENTMKISDAVLSKQKNPNLATYVACAVSGAIFALGLILAVCKMIAGNFILLIGGLLELGAAFVLFKIARQRERFTCPECGAKRVHHRKHLGTSEKITTNPSWGDATRDEGCKTITYTHQYLDTYTCEACGSEMSEKVSKGGGCYKVYNTGRIQDTTTDPMEF